MSDLSSPPLSLVPVDATAAALATVAAFHWPTPAYACYSAPQPLAEAEPCQIEGMNGRLMNGALLSLDMAEGLAKVRIPPARIAIPLRFNQFRRLTLTRPLAPSDSAAGHDANPLSERPAVDVKVQLNGAPALQCLSIGHRETEAGLFLFAPVDARGQVLRSFVPRAAYERFDIGAPIGEVLVADKAATPLQIEAALAEQKQLRSQKIGEILLTKQIVSAEELERAIVEQARMPMVRIGEALIALGFINNAQLETALSQQREDRSLPLGELLVRRGLVSRPDLQTALARKMGYPLVDVTQFAAESEALSRLPYAVASRLPALPLLLRGGRLIVAVEDPSRPEVIDDIEFASQSKVVPVLARASLLSGAVHKAYERIGVNVGHGGGVEPAEFDAEEAGKLLATLEQQQSAEAGDADELSIEQSDNSLVRLINSMIGEAQAQGVSDIHIECQPGREKVRIRFRKDGALRPYIELPHTYRSAMIARIKIMCDLDISERRKPQDGKINFGKFVTGARLELRVATIPTANGLEDAVLRLLASAKPIPLDNLGLSPDNLRDIKAAAQRPYGMLLCVGPTGSGKTTTLHSVLGYINQPDRKIWTAEDPVEITQAGMRQVQINPKIDWTFAKALRAFLRADPDVIMVGEIRDGETSKMAVEASLTGHLVMSTLHTNSAVETVTRLLDMGMDPFNFADSLLGVLAQRLVRRLCSKCVAAQPATPLQTEELMADYMHAFGQAEPRPQPDDVLAGWLKRFGKDGKLMHHFAKGCPNCDDSGLRGRAGLHELLVVSRQIRHLIQTGARPDELLRCALSEGLRTLRQDGIDKVWAGTTTIEEVRASSNA
jgi:type II secretory ATPase GspE/PulE/Tfp pilus assembly ATPase PilB-like protein